MDKKINKIFVMTIFIIALLVMFSINLSSIGIGFSQNIEASPGETINRVLSLQNLPAGNGDLLFTGTIEEGNEVISFPQGNEFEVSDGELVQAPIQIKIPANANVGQTYNVKISFSTSQSTEEDSRDTVQLNLGAGISFNVKVVEKSPEKIEKVAGSNLWMWILLVLIVIILIAILIKRKK